MLNLWVFQEIKKHKKQIVVVTKYRDTQTTIKILQALQHNFPNECIWIGENRIESLQLKQLPREVTHFIGNIQSRKISQIVKHCSTIHSLCSLKHAQKIESLGIPTKAFVQIHLDTQKTVGIPDKELEEFLHACKDFQFLKIIWISWMGSSEYDDDKKIEEFQKLCWLRDTYIPDGKISAGTSRDYLIAIQQWIDIVRVGKKVLKQ